MARLQSMGLAVLLTAACGGPPPTNTNTGTTTQCSAATCGGCCDAAGYCQSGTSQSFCGSGGASCSKCGSSCQNQVCVGGAMPSGSGGGAGGSGGGTGGTGGGGSTSSNQAPVCTSSGDCPYWYCDCASGPPVNSARCINNRCQSGAEGCPASCSAFNTCWLGTSSGGWSGGSNAGPSTCSSSSGSCPYSDLGKSCSNNSGCQSGKCYGISPSFVCTRSCSVASDCPKNWSCVATETGKVCMTGELNPSTPSTSTTCSRVSHTDVGQACSTSCSGGFCTGQICTRRCDVDADCPSTWSCFKGSSFKFCTP